MSKYYTPEIEEFHIGFEYEHRSDYSQINRDKDIWDLKIWSTNSKVSNITMKTSINGILDKEWLTDSFRVKYLDKEDIESLGFKFLQKNSLGNLTHRYEIKQSFSRIDDSENADDTSYWNLYLTHYPDRNRIFIKADVSCGNTDEKFFEGKIKNKSELKVLLKQLNIL